MPVVNTPNVLNVDTPCLAYLHWGISTFGCLYIAAYLPILSTHLDIRITYIRVGVFIYN